MRDRRRERLIPGVPIGVNHGLDPSGHAPVVVVPAGCRTAFHRDRRRRRKWSQEVNVTPDDRHQDDYRRKESDFGDQDVSESWHGKVPHWFG